MSAFVLNGVSYSVDGSAVRDMRYGGFRTWWGVMMQDFAVDVSAVAANAATASAAATAAANAAAALYGTSTTSVAIGTGSKGPFTTQASKQFAVGVFVLIYSTANPANYMYGQVTAYSGTSLTVDVAAVGGSGTLADWKIAVAGIRGATGLTGPNYAQARSAKVANYTLVAGDQGNLIDCSGTFNLTFTAASTLGTSWWCEVKNSGTGIVTLVRSSSDTIDGLTTYTMMPGEHRRFFCRTSSTFDSVVLNPFRLFGTTSTTMPMPPGYARLGFDLQGGGASGSNGGRGAAASATYGGRGGPGGGRHMGTLEAPAAGTTITLTKGDGGATKAGRTTDGNPEAGNNGSASTISWSSITRASASGGVRDSGLGAGFGGGYVQGDSGDGPPSGYVGGLGGYGSYYDGATATKLNGQSRAMGGAGGGGGGGRQAAGATGFLGSDGGVRGTYPTGGGGTGGASVGAGVAGNNGSTPTDGGGGGGSSATGNNAGNGGAGAGYGSGGGGGGAVDTGYTSGAGGAGTGGYFDIWGVV